MRNTFGWGEVLLKGEGNTDVIADDLVILFVFRLFFFFARFSCNAACEIETSLGVGN